MSYDQKPLAQSKYEYMEAAQLSFFKEKLEEKVRLLHERQRQNQQLCLVKYEPDEVDRAAK